jgi:hypothetical protein
MSEKLKKSLGSLAVIVILFLLIFGMNYVLDHYIIAVRSILMWILGSVAVIGGGFMLVNALRSSFNIARPAVKDVSLEGRQLIGERVQSWRDQLATMSFDRAGEYEDPSHRNQTGWCFLDEKRQIYVEIAQAMGYPMLQFTSVFGRRSVVETILSTIPIPDRNEVDSETYRLQIIRGIDLEAAYQAHIDAMQDFAIRFGEPVSMPPFAEAITWLPETYTDRYRQAKFKPNVMQALGFTLFFGAFAFLMWLMEKYTDPTNLQFALGMVFLSLIFMISPMIIPLSKKSLIVFELGMLATIGLAFASLVFTWWIGLVYGVGLVACLMYLLAANSKYVPVRLPDNQ